MTGTVTGGRLVPNQKERDFKFSEVPASALACCCIPSQNCGKDLFPVGLGRDNLKDALSL